jgi:hypothetical protein
LLKIGYRTITITGFLVLTGGFALLSMFPRDASHLRLYLNLIMIGAGLGLTMLTLLIAVQQAVERSQLGIATSMNQFSRAIGGAFGVAIMGAVLTGSLAGNLQRASDAGQISAQEATAFASNPNDLIDPMARARLSNETLTVLQSSMAGAVHTVFWVGTVACVLSLFVAFFLPKGREDEDLHRTDSSAGEKMLMAEQTVINARNQPVG